MSTVTTEPAPRGLETQSDRKSLEEIAARAANSYRSVGDTVYAILREAIVTGTFAPGDWLRQESLAEVMGVSRIPVRSALIQLESEGLVVFQPRRGVQVRTLTLDQVREAYDLRTLLESHGLRHSMATMTPERLRRLTELAEQLDVMAEGTGFVEARRLFYHLLYDGDRNPMLVKMVEELRTSVGLYMLGKRMSDHVAHAHRSLLQAVGSGDPDAAVACLVDHLKAVRAGVEQAITDRSPHSPSRRS